MLRSIVLLLAMALFVGLAPAGQAQDHAHGGAGPIRLTTHLADPAMTFVGSMNGFTALALGDDQVPDFHQDLPLRITLDGDIVFASNADSGHDYDGVQTVWVVFPRPGAFKVEALGEDGIPAATLDGTVLPLPQGVYGFSWNGGLSFPIGGGDVEITDEGSFDAWADVRNGARLLTTATLHAEEGTLAWTYIPAGPSVPQPVPLVFAARPDANDTRPAMVVPGFGFPTVGSGTPDVLGWVPGASTLPTETNAVIDVTGDGLRLIGTYDPWTRVGTETLQNLAILGLRPDGARVDDLRLSVALLGPRNGVVWSSSDILERDGIWEFASIQAEPGVYVMHAEATSAAGTATIDVPYLVMTPSDPAGAGPIDLAVAVPDTIRAGEAVPIEVLVKDATGAPFDHSEVLLDVFGPFSEGGGMLGSDGELHKPSAYTLRAKLHTHADGRMSMQYAFPTAGNYTLWLSPSSLEARPVAIGGAPLSFAAKTVQVTVLPAANATEEQASAGARTLGAPMLLLGLAAASIVLRRRR